MNQLEIEQYLDKLAQQTESDIEEVFNRRLQTILLQLARMYERYSNGDGEISWTDVNRYNRLQKELRRINKELTGAYQEIVEKLQTSTEYIYLEGYLRHMYLYEMSTGFFMRVTLPSMEVIQAVLKNPIDKLTLPSILEAHRNEIVRKINIEIAQGIQAGEGYATIARKVSKIFKTGKNNALDKARRVVRTETARSRSLASQEAEVKASQYVDITGVWMSALDLRVRHSHRILDGKETDSEGYFHYKSWKAKAPLMWNIPSMDIQCRCVKIRKVNGMLPEYRRGRNYMDEGYQRKLADRIEQYMEDEDMTYKQSLKKAQKEIQPPSTTMPYTTFEDWRKKFAS